VREHLKFYIDGAWVDPVKLEVLDVENPASETPAGRIALGSAMDVDKAVRAARNAFATWSQTSRQTRLEVLGRIMIEYQKRADDLVAAVTEEMGAPDHLARGVQVPIGTGHLATAINVLRDFAFEEARGATLLIKEPIGVCGFITPWNWPLNQIVCKVAPALAVGCTMVLKPSEVAPFSAHIFAEIIHAAGVPPGVFNLVHGDGPGVGTALSAHPDVDVISITGSTRAGVEVARNAAPTVKRVHQELGGKSANIILDDEDLISNVARGVVSIMSNSGQTCSAPTRMLVPEMRMDEAIAAAQAAVSEIKVGHPESNAQLGPVVSKIQWDKIQHLIQVGIDEGAILVAGGPGKPMGLDVGHYVKPTVFARVTNDMVIAREEVFGPVLAILGYESIDAAVAIANDSDYGLAAYVNGRDIEKARAVARRLRAGQVALNGAFDLGAPFGGYKRSGNGREWGDYAFHEFLETKAVLGHDPPTASDS